MIPKKHEKHMSNDARIAVLETTIININSTLLDIRQDMKRGFERVDNKFDALEKKMDAKFNAVDSKFEIIHHRLWSNFLWLMGMIIGLSGLIAHTQHWI